MSPDIPYHCRARGCFVRIEKHMVMCPQHWHMVPRRLQMEVFDVIGKAGMRDAVGAAVKHVSKVQEWRG